MASTGKRVRVVFAEIVGKKAESIQNTDKLIHYGYGPANFFSLFEKIEEGLNESFVIFDSDIADMMELETVKDLINLVQKISGEQKKEVKNRG
jgi:hypothetical protein